MLNPANIPTPYSSTPAWFMPAEQQNRSIDVFPKPSTSGGGGTNTTGDWPFKLVAVDTENVKVLLAQVNAITPTGIATNIDVSGTDGTWYIYIDATVDASTGAVTAADVSSNTTGVPSDSSTHSYRLIGQVVVSSSVISSVSPSLAWSQDFTACTPGDTATYHWNVA